MWRLTSLCRREAVATGDKPGPGGSRHRVPPRRQSAAGRALRVSAFGPAGQLEQLVDEVKITLRLINGSGVTNKCVLSGVIKHE